MPRMNELTACNEAIDRVRNQASDNPGLTFIQENCDDPGPFRFSSWVQSRQPQILSSCLDKVLGGALKWQSCNSKKSKRYFNTIYNMKLG
jgi:hypothetical protein